MTSKVPCALCATPILPATAARTGGRCMPCVREPEGARVVAHRASLGEVMAACALCAQPTLSETAVRTGGVCPECFEEPAGPRAVEHLAATTSVDELLRRLQVALDERTLRSARDAVATFGPDRIDGFWLMYEYFATFGSIAFTRESQEEAADWEPDWERVTDFDDPEMLRITYALDRKPDEEGDAYEQLRRIERVVLRTLRRVREEGILDRRVVLLHAAWDQSWEERFATAERVNDAATLETFRRELPKLDDQKLEQFRGRIPDF